ncbi:pilus assembly protein PilM [Candidatus Omnitrophota bacterium]
MINKVVGLEISEENIRVVELERGSRTDLLRIMAAIPTPEGAMQQGRIMDIEKISRAIRKLFSSAKISTKNVVLSLSGKGVAVQQITLPSMPKSEMKEIIRSELEKYIVLRSDGFIFDYQPLSEYNKKGYKKTRVFFTGISNHLINSYFDCIKKAGLILIGVDIAPLSIATSLYSDLKEDESTAMVFIDTKKTYITILKHGWFCLFHTIDIGTAQLAVASPRSQDALDKFASELKRSFKFFEMEFDLGKVDKVLLTFDQSKLKGIDKKVRAMLGDSIEVENANPFKRLDISKGSSAGEIGAKHSGDFAVCVGAALKGLNKTGHTITLENIRHYIPQPKEKLKRYAVALTAAALIILITAGITVHQNALCSTISNKLGDREIELARIDERLTSLKESANRHQYLREQLQDQARYLNNLNRVPWSSVLAEVTGELPEDAWLKKFESTDKGKMTLDGGTYSVDKVAGFIRELAKRSSFDDVGLENLEHKEFSDEVDGVEFKIDSILAAKKEKKDVDANSSNSSR